MYKLLENIKLALKAIWAKKVRSFLTMLGIIIGVFSIVLLIGIGQGVKKEVTSQIEGLGSNLLVVIPGKFEEGSMPTGVVGESTLTTKDVDIIKDVPGVEFASPIMIVAAQVSKDDQIASGPIVFGTNPEIRETMAGSLTEEEGEGQMFTEQDYQDKAKKAVIFTGMKEQLFPDSSPIGQIVKINNVDFEITAYQPSAVTSTAFNEQSEFLNMILIPLTTAQEMTNSDKVHRITIKVASTDEVEVVREEIKTALLAAHDNIEEFSLFTQEDLLSMFDQVLGVITTMLGGIAAISLLVGGIGVMNIMLVSVTERTHEIGLRKAIGASGSDILVQFLVEAILLTLLGGTIGVGLALLAGQIMSVRFGLAPDINVNSVLLAYAFTAFVGIFFGVAPAVRASRLDPIDALRYE